MALVIDTFDRIHQARIAQDGGVLAWPGSEDSVTGDPLNPRNTRWGDDH